MCAIYKVSRRKIERGVSWPVRQKASEACNLFLLQAGSIRPSPLGAIHLGDGHIYFLRYINMFGFRKYWIFGKYFHSTQAAPDQQVSFPTAAFPGYSYVTSGKIYPRTKFLIANLCYLSLMLMLYTGVLPLLMITMLYSCCYCGDFFVDCKAEIPSFDRLTRGYSPQAQYQTHILTNAHLHCT